MKPSEVLLAFVTRVYGAKAARAAKALLPATAAVLAVIAQWIASGEFGSAEFATALMGLGGAALTFVVPNLPALAEKLLKQGTPLNQALAAAVPSGGSQTEFRDGDDPESAQPSEDWTAERDEIGDVPDPPTEAEIQEAGRA